MMARWDSYMLGRSDERSHRNSVEIAEKLTAKLRGLPPSDVQSLQLEIAQLQEQLAYKTRHIAELNRFIDGQRTDYDRLKQWADEAESTIRWYKSHQRA